MIGRVLAFAVCVVVVVTEDCNTGADDACCLGTDYGSQLSGLGGTSLPVPTLVEAKSGFRDSVFRMTVELPVQYHTAHSGAASATVLDEEFSDMPNVMIGCMSAVCPTDITGAELIGTVDTTNCVFEIQTDFAFGDISSSLVSTPYNTDVQTEADNEAGAGTATYKYGAIEVQAAVNVFGETYQAEYSTRVVVDTMLYRLKFKTTVSVTTQTTVVYAAVQVSLGMFLTRVRVPDLGDYSVFSDLNGETCDTENTDVGAGADYCATLVTTRITVGVSTLVVNPYVTTLRTDTDNFAFAWGGSKPAFTPHPGFEIRDLDRNSGLRWIPGSGPRTIRRNNLNDEASTTATEVLDGTPGLFHTSSGSNCGEDTGICRQDYFLYMEYRSSKGDPEYFYNNVLDTGVNAGRNGDIDTYANDAPAVNTASNECQISGAEVNIGHGAQYNNANGLGDVGYAELKCRSDISYTRAVDDPVVVSLSDDVYPLTGGTFDPADFDGATVFAGDGACIFDPNGEDVEDDITFQITLSTADWCPSVSIQNQLAQAMTVDGATKMAGGPLVLNVHVRPAPGAAPSANSNTLPVTQLKIMTLQAQCDPDQDIPESCNIIADGYDGTDDSGEVMSMINTDDDNWRDVGLDYSENGEGCIIDDDKVDDDHPNSDGWCTIPAEVLLCEYTDVVDEPQATPGCYDGPGENREAAFDIDDAYTYTDVRFSATVQVAYEGVPFAKKAVNVEFSPHKNIVYRLLQSQTGSVDVDVEFGFQSPDHVTDSGDQVAADQTAGANDAVVEEAAVAESNSMLIYIIVGVFLFISVFVGALVMYLRRSKGEKKVHPVPITVEVNKSTAAMA